jgi:hypothetical protein
MSEQELIQALRELIAKSSAGAPDPRVLAREISHRDQQRIRLLAGLSIFFWLLAAAGLVLLCIGLDRFVIYARIANFPSSRPQDMEQMLWGTSLIHHSIWIVAGSVGALFLGALCTVLLVTTSRRATLQQINLRLMELSEQLKQLRVADPSEKVHRLEDS